jgi:hypothetical protein
MWSEPETWSWNDVKQWWCEVIEDVTWRWCEDLWSVDDARWWFSWWLESGVGRTLHYMSDFFFETSIFWSGDGCRKLELTCQFKISKLGDFWRPECKSSLGSVSAGAASSALKALVTSHRCGWKPRRSQATWILRRTTSVLEACEPKKSF